MDEHEWELDIIEGGIFRNTDDGLEFMDLDEAQRRLNATERYQELIMAVGNKYEGETRHETALRYILEAEQGSDIAYTDTLDGK